MVDFFGSALAGALSLGAHLTPRGIRLEHGLVEAADISENIALIIHLDERPGHVGDLQLNVAGVFEQIAERKEQLSLHAPNNIGDLFVRGTASTELRKGMPHTGVGLIGVSMRALATCWTMPGLSPRVC